jgi:hypothetical protein
MDSSCLIIGNPLLSNDFHLTSTMLDVVNSCNNKLSMMRLYVACVYFF